ncbi:protein extra-macrochaetae-like [Pollicipes pollicipes]|uniref:protein extra-macrochaetae-like n=1 Tax=Pollicipes pollicipes TaxID=41117 RepID=UPI0018857C18|nr:protein extra-macrochaetae-like [Pollicipes pollicipes]
MKTEMKPSRQPPAIFQQSRRLRRPRSADTERIRALLNRLQKIVPAAPKDRQLPQVQVIQHVINYICQLQDQVVRHPRLGKLAASTEATKAGASAQRTSSTQEQVPSTRTEEPEDRGPPPS